MPFPMRAYPAFLNLRERPVLVVGGGRVAARKARGLLRAGAAVTVVAPALRPGFPEGVRHEARRFKASDVVGRVLVMAATDDPAVNAAAAKAARKAGALVNIADDPAGSDFHVPSVLRRGRLTLAIATSGASPAVAKRLRRDLARTYGPSFRVYLKVLAGLRPLILSEVPDPALRRAVFRRLARPEFAEACAREGESGGRHAMLAVVREAAGLLAGASAR